MILFNPTPIVPKPLRGWFFFLRLFVVVGFSVIAVFFAYRTIFPSQEFLFSFENPDTAKNTLEEPVAPDGKSLKKGRVEGNEPLRTYAGTVGSFSYARVELTLESDSDPIEGDATVSFRKSYRSFLLPEGDPITTIPKDRGFVSNGTPYFFSDGKVFPFLSDAAALSRFPKDRIQPASNELFKIFPPEEEYAGFRPGTLLSDAEGVYAIGGDGKAHPIGNTSVFETLGFHWDDVRKVSEEEIRFHKRGKIFLYDALQPDGTVFSDSSVGKTFLIENETKRVIENEEYAGWLRGIITPIEVSETALGKPVTCRLIKKTLAIRPTYSCDVPIEALSGFPGGSFEISVASPQSAHIAALSVSFRTEPNRENLSLFVRQIRERFSAVYGN